MKRGKWSARSLHLSFLLLFSFSWWVEWKEEKRKETRARLSPLVFLPFTSLHFIQFTTPLHQINWMKNERKKIMKREHKWVKWVRGSSSFLLFVHHFIVGCVLCSSFFHSCFNSRAYFGSLVIEAWIKKEEEQRTQHQTQSCYLLFFALSFVFLSLQWFVMKARNHVKRKRNTKHKGKHHVLCFFLLSTNSRFISSLRSSFHCNWWKGRKEQRGVVEKDPKEPNGTQR